MEGSPIGSWGDGTRGCPVSAYSFVLFSLLYQNMLLLAEGITPHTHVNKLMLTGGEYSGAHWTGKRNC